MLDRTIKSIPTEYAGVMFRSRLEAKWANFFDIVGLNWKYEPCKLEGWIPDFLIANKWLAEVKPIPMTSMEMVAEPEAKKAMRDFDTLLLGDGPGDALGIVVRMMNGKPFARYIVADISFTPLNLVEVPFMLAGFHFGLADIWNGMPQPGVFDWISDRETREAVRSESIRLAKWRYQA